MDASLIAKGKDRGYLLSEEIIAVFPHAENDLESLDEFYLALFEQGIEVLDQEPPSNSPVEVERPARAARSSSVDHHRHAEIIDPMASGVNDSVRLYLQEIGETNLLTMQEEVWLSKRMERGEIAADRLRLAEYANEDERLELMADADQRVGHRHHHLAASWPDCPGGRRQ